MIVFGDAAFDAPLVDLRGHLRDRVASVRTAGQAEVRQDLRSALVLAGQLEQAVEDVAAADPDRFSADDLSAVRSLTDELAAAFVLRCRGERIDAALSRHQSDGAVALLDRAEAEMSRVSCSGAVLRVKVPEGFAYYSLFPEQYSEAAERWADDHAGAADPAVLVVGIRSIGTTLSAVVAAALRSRGWATTRVTIRPTGHPFDRRAALPSPGLVAPRAIVVDEGPGLSGSSMAAAGEALLGAGVARDAICFLPGHAGEPGCAGSERVRSWWAGTRRYVVPLEQVRWHRGRSLHGLLAETACGLCGLPGAGASTEDLSGGAWRGVLGLRPSVWPAVCGAFERTKVRCVLADGRAVLWKFMGLCWTGAGAVTSAERALAALSDRAGAGVSPRPLGLAHGFVAMEWIDGEPLQATARTPGQIDRMGRYIRTAAGRDLSPAAQQESVSRLAEMLQCNAVEGLGPAAGSAVLAIYGRALTELRAALPLPCYGDGRMAPVEWLRTRAGQILKVDGTGHDNDHTVVGAQPLLWDVAGAIVEWGLDRWEADRLLAASGLGGSWSDSLAFSIAAYAAFRLGQCEFCAGDARSDEPERARLRRAAGRYRGHLRAALWAAPI